ncbi:MAG: hypothetical protein Q4F54_05115 [Coriobacteriia bacterium]|nr:hypothetical protein [Coriobacteriia bacterium]
MSGEPATGWNTQADGSGFHYDFGTTFTVTEDTVTLYADWEAPTFKAVYSTSSNEVLFTYDKIDYDQSQYTVVEYKGTDSKPTLVFEDEASWNLETVRENFTTAKIDESMKSLPLVQISYMFSNMKELTQIEGLENLSWNTISDVKYMFANLTSLKEITLPSGIFANIELWSDGETAFSNNVLETITNEAPIVCQGEPADFNRFWESYRTWIDVDTGEAYPRFTPIPAGTFTVNKVSWSDTSKVASVKGYDEEYTTYFDPVTLNSGDKIPSWVRRLEIRSTDEGATGYMAKVSATTPEGKDVVYYANYSPAYGAVSINLGNEEVCSSYDIDVEIYTPESTHTITANFEDANLTDEAIYNYFTTKGWTKVDDSVYTKEFNHGITISGVMSALPDSGITYKYNNPYTMDAEKVFQQ